MDDVSPLLSTLTSIVASYFPDRLRGQISLAAMQLSDETRHPGIKDLALNVLQPAKALTLLKVDQYVSDGSKADICTQYQIWINDQWTGFIQDIYNACHQRWPYLIPQNGAERYQLRSLCQQALAFENHFLSQHKNYILSQMQDAEP